MTTDASSLSASAAVTAAVIAETTTTTTTATTTATSTTTTVTTSTTWALKISRVRYGCVWAAIIAATTFVSSFQGYRRRVALVTATKEEVERQLAPPPAHTCLRSQPKSACLTSSFISFDYGDSDSDDDDDYCNGRLRARSHWSKRMRKHERAY